MHVNTGMCPLSPPSLEMKTEERENPFSESQLPARPTPTQVPSLSKAPQQSPCSTEPKLPFSFCCQRLHFWVTTFAPGISLFPSICISNCSKSQEALEPCQPHPLTLAQLFVANALLLNSGPLRGNSFNRNNSELSQALPSGRLERSFQDIWLFWRKHIQLMLVFSFNMPREWSCTLASGGFLFFFFLLHSTLINRSPTVTEILRWMWGKKMERAETLFPYHLFISWAVPTRSGGVVLKYPGWP